MNQLWRSRKTRTALASLCLAITLITCGPSGAEMVGDAMVDAGGAVREAGLDAADAIRDATADAVETVADTGGDALRDTGEAIRDGASDDAMAQDTCTTCTTSGAAHTVLASEDPGQALGGTLTLATGRGLEVAVGPLYVTDVSAVDPNTFTGGGSSGSSIVLVSVPLSAFCDDSHLITSPGITTETFVAAAATYTSVAGPPIHGARLFVPVGRRLCAQISGGIGAWSGFRPYD